MNHAAKDPHPAGRPARRLGAGALVLVVLGACGGGPPPAPRYPGTLRPPSELGADVMMRQHLVARWGDGESAELDAVLQKQGDALLLLGLGPGGGRGFVIEHRAGQAVRFEKYVDIDLPFPPRFVLLDVQRVFFPYLGPPPAEDGAREGVVDGDVVHEVWRDGALIERTFRRADGDPEGVIRVDYGPGLVPGRAPPASSSTTGGSATPCRSTRSPV